MVVRCKSCMYWDNTTTEQGWCYRFPASLPIGPDHWCGEGKAKKKAAKPKSEDPDVKKIIDYYHKSFVEKFDVPPSISGGKDGNSVRGFLVEHTAVDAEKLITAFFDEPPSFYAEKGLYGLSHIISSHNQMIVKMARKAPKKGLVDSDTSKLILDEAHSWGNHPRYSDYCSHIKEMNESIDFETWLHEYTS